MAWPTTNDPKRNFVTTRFTDAEAAELDAAALRLPGRQKGSRSAYVRNAVARCVRADARKQKDRAASEGEVADD